MDIAATYSEPLLGEGYAKLDKVLGEEWPDAKGAIWLGGTGKALAVDSAFRAVPGEKIADFAELMKAAVARQDAAALDAMLVKMPQLS